MKKGLLRIGIAGLGIFTLASVADAAVIFGENFDNTPPYSDNTAIPNGYGTINLGQWSTSAVAGGSAIASTSVSLSATRSMALSTAGTANESITGFLDTNNTAPNTPTTSAVVVRFAFNLPVTTALAQITLRANSGANYGFVQIGVANTARVFVSGADTRTLGSISANTWYYLEMSMPANPSASIFNYTTTLYQSDGTTVVGSSVTAPFQTTPTGATSYGLLTFAELASTGTSYFDNITVNTVPEPSVTSYGAAALLAGGCWVIVRRRRKVA